LNAIEHDTTSIHPSQSVSAFLERIESADPNAPDISEDDTDANWGHYQFTAGNLRCSTVLSSWDEIGATTAKKLIAAALKTCQVARHICFEHGVNASGYLSDAYLQTLIQSLWTSWTAKKTTTLPSQNENVQNGTASGHPLPRVTLTLPAQVDDTLNTKFQVSVENLVLSIV
jgi:hypothetical protein